MSNVFSGLVIGGPLDGKRLDHYASEYRVPIYNDVSVLPYASGAAPTMATIKTFDYFHYKMAGTFVWLPQQIRRGEKYENRRYNHPMDFVLAMLIRCYRPDGY